eukprot:TRINITY_DN5191_c0_g1_i2.p1 TRINITY_DN5191_c0_g1~~TRINITY_DN5191_c0_g1_i2.p1  ORF type:complete len:239 (+),score=48.65 TRINITY_DN5191_c0_g1_i2:203-919(+)
MLQNFSHEYLQVAFQVRNGFDAIGLLVTPPSDRLSEARVALREQLEVLSKGDFAFVTPTGLPISESQERLLSTEVAVGLTQTQHRVLLLARRSPLRPSVSARHYGVCIRAALMLVVLAIVVLLAGGSDREPTADGSNPPSWVFFLLSEIVYVVYECVLQYFVAFKYCWALTGGWLVTLISGYYHLLEKLFESLLAWPTVIVVSIAANGTLFWVWKYFQIIFRYRMDPKLQKSAAALAV